MTYLALARPMHSFASRFAPAVLRAPFRLREERAGDLAAREALLDEGLGAARRAKTCERLRENRAAAEGLSFVATLGREVAGTLRLWHVEAGDRPALLLGPLAVARRHRSAGIGAALVEHGLRRARAQGHAAVILVGDAAYYERFGFARRHARDLTLPGPVDEDRFLGIELVPGALEGTRGRVVGTGPFLDPRAAPPLAA